MAEVLLGRELEREVIERLLSGAVAGESACLVLRGDAGIGKSALLSLGRRPAGALSTTSS
jgi:hypothetical protein